MLDFSTTTSQLGIPESVKQAVAEAAAHLDVPPDPECTALRRQIGETEEIDPNMIYCGADSEDLIWRLVEAAAPRKAMVPVPVYDIYETAFRAYGCAVERHMLWESGGFSVGHGLMEALNPALDCLVLCQPNNPTGLLIPQQRLLALIDKCARCGIYLFLDETFLDFLENPLISTEKPLLARYPNLILIKSPSLTHGMAGLKLAYCMTSNLQLIDRLRRLGRPCMVSSVAQFAGIAALQDTEYMNLARRTFAQRRAHMTELLENAGATVYPGETNFLLFHTWVPDLAEQLKADGFLVRDCADFVGLMPGYCRISLRTMTENASLAKAVHRILKKHPDTSPAQPDGYPVSRSGKTIL